jgi:hypothetical protein
MRKITHFHNGVTGSALLPMSMMGKEVLPTNGPLKRSFARIFHPLRGSVSKAVWKRSEKDVRARDTHTP